MGVDKIEEREEELIKIAFREMRKIPGLHILADNIEKRLGAVSFFVDNIHFNLIVKLLNDRFGVQVRGGCSCAGTYGHYLLHLGHSRSKHIFEKVDHGDLSERPGWVRMSIHPTMKDEELIFITKAIAEIVNNIGEWKKEYKYIPNNNEFIHNADDGEEYRQIRDLYKI